MSGYTVTDAGGLNYGTCPTLAAGVEAAALLARSRPGTVYTVTGDGEPVEVVAAPRTPTVAAHLTIV